MIELRDVIRILAGQKRIIIAAALLGLVVGATVNGWRSRQSEGTFSLIIRPKVIEKTENFQLTDVLEASDRVTRMTENWLKEQQLNIATKRLGNQFIRVSFTEQSQTRADERITDITSRTNTFLGALSPAQGLGSFEALAADKAFGQRQAYRALFIGAGLFLGLIMGLFVALVRYSMSSGKE